MALLAPAVAVRAAGDLDRALAAGDLSAVARAVAAPAPAGERWPRLPFVAPPVATGPVPAPPPAAPPPAYAKAVRLLD